MDVDVELVIELKLEVEVVSGIDGGSGRGNFFRVQCRKRFLIFISETPKK